ncbi:MAG: hypothetical protein ACI4TI_01550 [Christensenellales bacterium]
MALLLVASICLAATGAWFTSSVNKPEKELTFGTIAISSTGDTSIVAATSAVKETTTLLMPGDTLEISYKVKNDGEAAYVLSYVTVTATPAADKTLSEAEKTAIENLTGWYSATGNTKATACAELAKGAAEADWKHSVELTGTKFGNGFQGATVKVTVKVVAIQQENLTNEAALALLQGSDLDIATGVVGA